MNGTYRPLGGLDEPCFTMGVAARMVSMHPQTLRRYEDLGLVCPARTGGKRLYSARDIERLRKISQLTDELGVNLAGVEVILHMHEQMMRLQEQLEHLQAEMKE